MYVILLGLFFCLYNKQTQTNTTHSTTHMKKTNYHGIQEFEQVNYNTDTDTNTNTTTSAKQNKSQADQIANIVSILNNDDHHQQHQRRNLLSCRNVVGLVILLVVGNFLLYRYYYVPTMAEAQKYAAEIRRIQTETSKIEIMDPESGKIYRPDTNIITPQKIPQKQPTPLNFTNYQKTQQYSNGIRDNFQFSRYLFDNWLHPNPILQPAEYYRYNKTYNLDRAVQEKRMCIMAPFRNLLKYGGANGSFQIFLQSINAQNYSNYHVYMIDDASTDNSSQTILKQLPKYPRLNNRITILKNQKQIGALGNRDSTTRHYCKSGDIVMDIDGDDALIGRQVFNFINRLYYNNPQAWFIYTNFIQIKADLQGDGRHISVNIKKSQKGICKKIKQYVHLRNSYRTELDWWMTSQLRTYLWDLYSKIPLSYVIEKASGRYYFQASDRFTMYALVELAGINHTYYFDQYNYFYYQPNFDAWRVQTKSCTIKVLFYCEAQARILTPLLPLTSLNDTAKQTPNYQIPNKITRFYLNAQFQLFQCLKRKWAGRSNQF